MKTLRSFLLVLYFLAFECSAIADVVNLHAIVPAGGGTVYSATEVVLATGDTAQILCQLNSTNVTGHAVVEIDGKEFEIRATPGGTSAEFSGFIFAGPARIRTKITGPLAAEAGKSAVSTVNVTRAGTVPTITPQNAAVIPADATGNFSVILESSTDLITWTPATPGTYSGTTQKRFFRTRIVRL